MQIAVFQAERHTTASNYKLTLGGFVHAISQCTSTCGDGIVTSNEACDLGTAKNTGQYGTCNANCTLSAYCGDAIKQSPPEQCDDGNNTTLYDNSHLACGPGCILPHYCGDAILDSAYGELCDNGSANSDSAYGPWPMHHRSVSLRLTAETASEAALNNATTGRPMERQ